MYKRIVWLCQEIRWFIIGVLHVLTGKYYLSDSKYGKHELHSASEGNDYIRDRILSGEPFAYCRFSYTEMTIMIHATTQQYFGIPATKMLGWMDIFCEEGEKKYQGAYKYNALMQEAFKNADMLGIWKNLHMGDQLLNIQDTKDNVILSDANSVESYYYDNPWSSALEGKRVLVVSPFSKQIEQQYEKRINLWDNQAVLPRFSLEVEDSIWYYKGKRDERFSNWFEAYDYLFEQIMKHDFDIAILGCGYFGFALATRIKNAGRQAVHMGGATQLLFGIKGKRWDNNPKVNRFYNEYWIRPDNSKKPEDDNNLDNGCYW